MKLKHVWSVVGLLAQKIQFAKRENTWKKNCTFEKVISKNGILKIINQS